jgi:hypothetical protein
MTWDGMERRIGKDRRLAERRRTMRYNVEALVIIDGITWIDSENDKRRQTIRRQTDRQALAQRVVELAPR